jgi:hypothetical protein
MKSVIRKKEKEVRSNEAQCCAKTSKSVAGCHD